MLVACENPPPAASSNRPLPGDLPGATTVLDDRTVDALHQTLRSIPPPDFVPPRPSAAEVRRWSDVPEAVAAALAANGGAVLRRRTEGDVEVYTFKLTDGRRGAATVTRLPAPQVAAISVRVDSAVPALELERAVEGSFEEAFDASSRRRRLEDLGG